MRPNGHIFCVRIFAFLLEKSPEGVAIAPAY